MVKRRSVRRSKNKGKGKTGPRMTVSRPGQNREEGVREPRFPLRASLVNKTYKVMQTAPQVTAIISSSSGPSYSFINFYFGLLDNVAAWQTCFDQYRVDMLEVTFRPRMSFESSSTANTGTFVTVVDVDDSTTLTSVAAALDYATALTGRGFEIQKRTFKPHAAIAAYSGSFTSYANVTSPWIDMASTSVYHYGVKTAWTQTDSVYTIDTTTRVLFTLRNVR
jgi:hypothetical protein